MVEGRIPQRSCVGCRTRQEKNCLVRLVRSPDGRIYLDHSGRAPGRGAYLCPRQDCLEKALKKGNLGMSLHSPLSLLQQEEIRKEFARLEERNT